MSHLTFDPYIPLALWVPLAAAAGALLAWYGAASRRRLAPRRWPWVMTLMTLVVVVPLVILLNPTWLQRIPPPAGKPLLTILVDRSASMGTRDADAGAKASRYESACRTAAEMARQLADRYEVRVSAFAEDCTPAGADQLAQKTPDGEATDLAAAVEQSLEADRPQGQAIVVLSDGAHNAGGGAARVTESATRAKAMAVPLFVHTLGGEAGVRDLQVSLNMPQELAFIGQRVPVPVSLRQRGSLGRRTQLSLVYEGKIVEKRDVDLVPDGTVEVLFHVAQPTAGLYRYEVKADPLPEEVTELNNAATLLLRVVDQPIRILLLEGKPYWDTKFLVRTLTADQAVELTSVVKMAEGRLLERKITRRDTPGAGAAKAPAEKPGPAPKPPSPPAPLAEQWSIRKDAAQVLAGPEALAGYQIVILGRDVEVFLTDPAIARLKRWLTDSEGSLVCFRGPPSSQIGQHLGELMPVHWTPTRETRFRVRWTSVGQSLRWLPTLADDQDALASLPSLAAVARPERSAPLAQVLAASAAASEGPESPAIAYHPVGNGRVVVIEGAGMWRWDFLPPQFERHDEVYAVLWRSLIRWLVANVGLLPSEQIALRTDKVIFSNTEGVTATLLVRQHAPGTKPPQIELTGDTLSQPKSFTPMPSGTDPGQFRVAFGKLPEGRYWAKVTGDWGAKNPTVAAFDVRGNLAERLDVQAQPNLMRRIAEKSGGGVLETVAPDRLAQQFEAHLAQTRPERVARSTAWDRWWVLAAAMGVWGAAWGLRRWSGLV
jgi:hypothetical protein